MAPQQPMFGPCASRRLWRRLPIGILVLALMAQVIGLLPIPGVTHARRAEAMIGSNTNTPALLSASGSQSANAGSATPSISDDGLLVMYATSATNIVSGVGTGVDQRAVVLQNTGTGAATRLSTANTYATTEGNALSGDGTLAAFEEAGDIRVVDTHTLADVTVIDDSADPALSHNGRFLAFVSDTALDAAYPTGNGHAQVYVRDLLAETTSLVSVNQAGQWTANQNVGTPTVSDDGRWVAFDTSDGTYDDIGGTPAEGLGQVYLRDRLLGTTHMISRNGSTVTEGYDAQVSADGEHVVFQTDATSFGPDQCYGGLFNNDHCSDVALYSIGTGLLTNLSSSGYISDSPASYENAQPAISADGSRVVFVGSKEDPAWIPNVFSVDINGGDAINLTNTRYPMKGSYQPATSGDGRFVAFRTNANNLVPGDFNNASDIILGDINFPITPLAPPTGTELTGGGNPAENTPQPCAADPVHLATGHWVECAHDIVIPGRGPGLKYVRTYDSSVTTSGPLGPGWTDDFSMSIVAPTADGGPSLGTASAVEVHQENGSVARFVRQADGSWRPAADRVLASLTNTQDGGFEFERRLRTTFHFDAAGRLTSLADLNGNSISLSYSSGRLSTVTDETGRTLTFTYNGSGLLTQIAGPAGRTVGFGYTSGRLTSATDAENHTTQYGYYANGRLKTITDPRGGTVTSTYDTSGRVVSQTDQLNRTTTLAYTHPNNDADMTDVVVTDPRGIATRYRFYVSLLMARTDNYGGASAATWTFDYDRDTGGVASTTDPNGKTSTATYDAEGRRVSATDALGRTVEWDYDNLGDVTEITDPAGTTQTFTYDANGNRLTQTVPLTAATSATTGWTYGDPAHPGDVTAVTNPNGKTTAFDHNSHGDLVGVTDPLGHETTATYNAAGDRLTLTSPRGNEPGATASDFTTTFDCDGNGRLLSVTDPLGHATSYDYDANGNRTEITTPNGKTTTRTFDAANQLIEVERPDTTTINYDYDLDGNRTEVTNPNGKTTVYGFDQHNRPKTETDPLSRTTSYGYDDAGNRTSVVHPDGDVTELSYDDANQLTGTHYQDPNTSDVTYTYSDLGQRDTMSDGTGTTTYVHDLAGRLTDVTNGAGRHVGYGYDPANQLTTITYPNGKTVTRRYDDAGRIDRITDWLGKATTFGYNPDGLLSGQADPNGVSSTQMFNRAGQLTGISHATSTNTLASFTYTRDNAGQLTGDTSTGLADPAHSYGYDDNDRLTDVDADHYAYDDNDRLTRHIDGRDQAYDDADELTDGTAQITLVGASSAGDPIGVQPAPVPAIPAATAAGDVIVLVAVVKDSATMTVSAANADGNPYTKVGAYHNGATTSGTQLVVFTRTAKANEPNPVLTYPTGSLTVKSMVLAVYRGVNPDDPVDVIASTSASGTSSSALGVTPTRTGTRLLIAAGATGNNTTAGHFTSIGGTSIVTRQDNGANGQLRVASILGDEPRPSGASTGLRSVGFSTTAAIVTASLALRPASMSYGYDDQGNRTSVTATGGPTTHLSYDEADRLTGYGTIATYSYDGDGTRTAKAVGPTGARTTTAFTYDGGVTGLPILLEQRQTGPDAGPSVSYIYGPDGQPLEQIQASPEISLVGTTVTSDPTGVLGNTTAAPLTADLPAGVATGDQILVAASTKTGTTISTPAGYTRVGDYASGTAPVISLFRRTATGADPAPQLVFSGGTLPAKSAVVAAYRGVDPDSPVDGPIASNGTTGSATINISGVTTSHENDRLLALFTAMPLLPGSWSAPNGMTARAQTIANQPQIGTLLADQTLGTAGPTGARAATYSNASGPAMRGLLIALKPIDPVLYFHHDQLGSTRLLTDSHGTVVSTWTYDPYGRTVAHSGASATSLLYTGQYQDDETQAYYLRARYYEPSSATFMSRDPLVSVTGAAYVYAGASPHNATDPSGLVTLEGNAGISYLNVTYFAGSLMIDLGFSNLSFHATSYEAVVTVFLQDDPLYPTNYIPRVFVGTLFFRTEWHLTFETSPSAYLDPGETVSVSAEITATGPDWPFFAFSGLLNETVTVPGSSGPSGLAPPGFSCDEDPGSISA